MSTGSGGRTTPTAAPAPAGRRRSRSASSPRVRNPLPDRRGDVGGLRTRHLERVLRPGTGKLGDVYHRYTYRPHELPTRLREHQSSTSPDDDLSYLSAAADGEGRIYVTCRTLPTPTSAAARTRPTTARAWTERENIDTASWSMPAVGVRLDAASRQTSSPHRTSAGPRRDLLLERRRPVDRSGGVHQRVSDQGVISLEKKRAACRPPRVTRASSTTTTSAPRQATSTSARCTSSTSCSPTIRPAR